MRLGPDFEKKYCADILAEVKQLKIADTESADYDDIIDDPYGIGQICVVYAGKEAIDIEDMFQIDEEEYRHRHPSDEAWKVREMYRSRFKITEGIELFEEELRAIKEETARIAREASQYREMIQSATAISTEEGSDLSRRLFAGKFG